MASSPKVPAFPKDDAWELLIKSLKLDKRAANELEHAIRYALIDLNRYFVKQLDRKGRKSQINRLKRFHSALELLIAHLRNDKVQLKKVLPLRSREVMGLLLADWAAGQGAFQLDSKTDADSQRKDLGLDLGIDLLGKALAEIKSPIDQLLGALEPDRGGREGNVVRDTLIIYLADNAEAIIGKRATATAEGKFEKICDEVLGTLGLSNNGLKEAIPRALKKRALIPVIREEALNG